MSFALCLNMLSTHSQGSRAPAPFNWPVCPHRSLSRFPLHFSLVWWFSCGGPTPALHHTVTSFIQWCSLESIPGPPTWLYPLWGIRTMRMMTMMRATWLPTRFGYFMYWPPKSDKSILIKDPMEIAKLTLPIKTLNMWILNHGVT